MSTKAAQPREANRAVIQVLVRVLDILTEQLEGAIYKVPNAHLKAARKDLRQAKSNFVDFLEETE